MKFRNIQILNILQSGKNRILENKCQLRGMEIGIPHRNRKVSFSWNKFHQD